MGQPTKPLVFISHIDEEKEIALALKALVEKAFVGMVRLFVSSSPTSIEPGSEWLEKIKDALKSCEIEIIIVSPTSVSRPWINFEAGAVWSRGRNVIPLCHSGLTKSKLGKPLEMLQAGTATDENNLRDMLVLMANKFGSDVPEIDVSAFIATVKAFEKNHPVTVAKTTPTKPTSPSDPTDGFKDFELAIIDILSDRDPSEGLPIELLRRVADKMGVSRPMTTIAIKSLERKELVEVKDFGFLESREIIRLTSLGWEWLNDNADLLQARKDEFLPMRKAVSDDSGAT